MAALQKYVEPSCLPTWMEGNCQYPEFDGKVMVEFLENYQHNYDGK